MSGQACWVLLFKVLHGQGQASVFTCPKEHSRPKLLALWHGTCSAEQVPRALRRSTPAQPTLLEDQVGCLLRRVALQGALVSAGGSQACIGVGARHAVNGAERLSAPQCGVSNAMSHSASPSVLAGVSHRGNRHDADGMYRGQMVAGRGKKLGRDQTNACPTYSARVGAERRRHVTVPGTTVGTLWAGGLWASHSPWGGAWCLWERNAIGSLMRVFTEGLPWAWPGRAWALSGAGTQ